MIYDHMHNFQAGAPWIYEGVMPQAYIDASRAFQQHQLMMQYPMMYPMNMHPAIMQEQQYPAANAQNMYAQTNQKVTRGKASNEA